MKGISICAFLPALALLAIAHADPAPLTKGMGMAVMPKELPATGSDVATAAQVQAMQVKSKAGKVEAPDFERNTWSIERTSQFIHYGDETTLVPKGAILHVPDRLKSCIVTEITGNIVSWNEFAARHRALLTFIDVDLDQASGAKGLDPSKLKSARSTGMIVVALYQRSPISVALPAEPNSGSQAAASGH